MALLMEGILGGFRRRIRVTAELVAFPHTIFALPFAFMGMLLGADGRPTPRQFLWILAAMIGARTAAMSFNRIADRQIDAANPRTLGRPLPSGRLGLAWAVAVMAASCGFFVLAAWMLSPVCLALSPLALAIVLGYSYTKRFTSLSHLLLGLSLAVAPVGAWIAVSGPWSSVPALLAVAVLCWTAGFDIIYACQDLGFDRSRGLRSIPVRFGLASALKISSALHMMMVIALAAMGFFAGLGGIYVAGLTITSIFLVYEHRLVRPDDLSKVNLAFFTMNGWVSVVLLLTTALDLYL
jgi:4-hydroxybenzoate polyprenyltransferase